MAHLREILTFYQCDKCEAKFPTRQLAVDHKCAKRAEALKPSYNTQSTAIAQICDDMAASVGSVPAGRDVTNRRIGEWERRLRAL